VLVWVVTRAFIVAHVGFWDHLGGIDYEDVHQFQVWAEQIVATGSLPTDSAWQYPPGAGFMMLLPRLSGGDYGQTFVILMLFVDLAGALILALFGRRRGSFTGLWVWLLGMPLLGSFPVLRFDVVPTVICIAALVVIHRRPAWFGVLVGLGAALKVWPIVLLFGEWDRRRLAIAAASALACVGLVVAAGAIAFGNPLSFVSQQGGRGLQVESVAAAPWQLREVVTGTPVPEVLRFGAWEIPSSAADFTATALDLATLLVLVTAAAWWWLRGRAIGAGREDLANETVARDFVFTIVLALVVTSRVLSPQYMIWLLGLVAIVLNAAESRVRRPALVVLGALVLSAGVHESAGNTLIRNLALLAALADATYSLWIQLRRPPKGSLAAAATVPAGTKPAASGHPEAPSSSPA
jgi:hypothetical protein